MSLNFVNGVELDESSWDYIKSNESLFIENNYNNYNVLVENNYNNDLLEIRLNENLTQNNINTSDYSSLILCDDNYTIIEGFNSNFSTDLPPYFLDNNVISSIKNQENYGNCWAFGTLSSLESNILKINSTMEYDFSENNMKNLMSSQSDYGIKNNSVNTGGYDFMAMGYLTSWLGPVLESEDPYMICNISTRLGAKIHVQNILFNQHNLESIKQSVFNYGAVSISYNHNESFYNNIYHSYLYEYFIY